MHMESHDGHCRSVGISVRLYLSVLSVSPYLSVSVRTSPGSVADNKLLLCQSTSSRRRWVARLSRANTRPPRLPHTHTRTDRCVCVCVVIPVWSGQLWRGHITTRYSRVKVAWLRCQVSSPPSPEYISETINHAQWNASTVAALPIVAIWWHATHRPPQLPS